MPRQWRQWIPQHMLRDRESELGRAGMTVRKSTYGVLETTFAERWLLTEFYEVQDGMPVVAEIRIFPAPPVEFGKVHTVHMYGERSPEDQVPPGGITARLMREPKVAHAAEVIEHYCDWTETNFGREALDQHSVALRRGRPAKRRKGRSNDLYYAGLASEYAKLCADGDRSPIKTISEGRNKPASKIRSHVRLARQNGFLSDAPRPGARGGKVTEHAMQVLRQADQGGK